MGELSASKGSHLRSLSALEAARELSLALGSLFVQLLGKGISKDVDLLDLIVLPQLYVFFSRLKTAGPQRGLYEKVRSVISAKR
jgi:hypothetical protein